MKRKKENGRKISPLPFIIGIPTILVVIYYTCFGLFIIAPREEVPRGITFLYFRVGISPTGYVEIPGTFMMRKKYSEMTVDDFTQTIISFENAVTNKNRLIASFPFYRGIYDARVFKWMRDSVGKN